MVRLKDIAAVAGVSLMTVSKVLRDKPDISPATKARVRQIAQQMGYSPDTLAQALRTRRTRLIGLVISAVTNPIFARSILAIEERAQELGYNIVLTHSLNEAAREDQVIRRLLSRRVDGLIVSPAHRLAPTAPVYQEVLSNGTPMVILGQKAPFCAQFLNAESDDLNGMQHSMRHLVELGHKQIAFLAGPAAAPWAHERLEGYRKGLRDANIELDERFVFAAGVSIEDGEKAALQMLNEQVHPTAIQACNDLVAIGAASVLLQQGVRIPEEISIAGYGNVLLAEYFRVPLTTVRQPKFRLGEAAMEILGKLLREQPAESKRLPAELIIRGSTARAAMKSAG
jgi:DNA-binding LacI/PurR family transcriptional regulator